MESMIGGMIGSDLGNDTLLAFGDEVKALGEVCDGKGRVGGYLVVWGDAANADMVGDWFTPRTYFGAHEGNGADAMIHHGLPLKNGVSGLEWTQDKLLPPLKTRRDEVGLFAETVCDLADAYEAKIYELVKAGKLKWSSGAASHTVRRRDGRKAGEIVRWPIIEGSLTPTPCQPVGTLVTSLKALAGEPPSRLKELCGVLREVLEELEGMSEGMNQGGAEKAPAELVQKAFLGLLGVRG